VNPATALARALLAELVHQGVREVVLAPGSRSAPLAFEALRLDRAGRIRLHVRIDERSAGFLALGLAKVSGSPVAVICTSGTAVANLAPAVVEASYSAIPLVVLTADRPVEARGVGSPQTIDQVEFFGQTVRFFADLGAARGTDHDDPHAAQRAARASVGMAMAAAVGAPAGGLGGGGLASGGMAHSGPVHLNVGFRIPLVPDSEGADPEGDPGADPGVADGSAPPDASPPRPRRPPLTGCDHRDAREALGELPARGVILAGDLPCTSLRGHHQWLSALAEACGWPIIAEPSATLHGAPTALGHGVLVLGSARFLADHTPDIVLTVGQFGLSRPTMDLLRQAGRHVAIELPTVGREVCDPLRTAERVLPGIPLPPAEVTPDAAWLAGWQAADAVAAEVVADEVARAGGLTGLAAVTRVWDRAPDDALLLVAASWPVRQVEIATGRRAGLRVVGNRGANGIDGLVSTAWGAALAHQAQGGGPALALMGDLALLHDHNGLLVGADEPRPNLVVVVLDNDGGGIFHQLEQGRPEHAGSFERVFGTPLGRDLVAVARAAGVPAERVSDLPGLEQALTAAMDAGGVHVIVTHVPDRAGEARLMASVRDGVAARLSRPGA
jgi:2-succinyl-5-enolpyruvyl-6-hydroxy-3-cyclohexene-1-carboxylate synthase